MTKIATAIRIVAARRLQKLGWAVVHYAQAAERACLDPSQFREDVTGAWVGRVLERFAAFIRARDAYRRAILNSCKLNGTLTVKLSPEQFERVRKLFFEVQP